MKAPRKKKKRKTGRPLEDVPLHMLVRDVEKDLKISLSDSDKPKRD
jgi:hypothetical protein